MSSVNSAVYGVSWVHKKSSFQEPSDYPVVKQVVDAARRILARPAERKEPLSSVVVQKVISRLEKGNLGDLQLAALFSLGFFGFLRWDDLRHLSVHDSFYFADSHVATFLEQRKNDQFLDRLWVFVACCNTPPCPVQIVEKFFGIANHSKGSPLFRRVLQTKRRIRLRKKAMSYSRTKELIKKGGSDRGAIRLLEDFISRGVDENLILDVGEDHIILSSEHKIWLGAKVTLGLVDKPVNLDGCESVASNYTELEMTTYDPLLR